MSVNFLKYDRVVLDKNLELTIFESISFYDRFRNGDSIDSRRLFDEFSSDQRSHLRNAYIMVVINSFYVDNNVVGGGIGLEREVSE
jgi:hypothetical protein